MKGIKLCGECANYSYKKHKCLLGCNKETDPRSKFYEDCPLPDAVEVKHGKWISQGSGYNFVYKCSECGYIDGHPFEDRHNFCPHCGLPMRQED